MPDHEEASAQFSSSAEVTGDPLRDLPVGAQFEISVVDFGGSDASPQLQGVTNWGFFDGAILGVGLKDAGDLCITGTAVMIAPGLAVTAAHVFRDSIDELRTGDRVPYCLGPRSNGHLDIWRAVSLSIADDDIAFLSLELNSALVGDWSLRRVPVTTRMPVVGESLTILGFRIETTMLATDGAGFAGELLASRGVVQEIYEDGRDSVMVPYPAIEILCESRGAMSGGAVFDDSGHLVGIISVGMEMDGGGGPTYASWIVPGLFRDVSIPWPPGVYPNPARVASARLLLEGNEYLSHREQGGSSIRWVR